MNEHTNAVILHINANRGYAVDQIDHTITLGDLIAQLQEAASEFGDDARVVLFDGSNRYGANYGSLARYGSVVSGTDEVQDEDGEW